MKGADLLLVGSFHIIIRVGLELRSAEGKDTQYIFYH